MTAHGPVRPPACPTAHPPHGVRRTRAHPDGIIEVYEFNGREGGGPRQETVAMKWLDRHL